MNEHDPRHPAPTDLGTARDAIDELLDTAAAAISPPLRWADGPYTAVEHEHPYTREPDGTAHLEKRRYLMTRVAADRYPELLGQLEAYWRGRGWAVSAEPDPVLPVLRAESPSGAVELRIGIPGNATLLARVAPVPAVGTGYPFGGASTVPLGPDGALDTVPRHDDPYWSGREGRRG
ncbi:hypothetical protein AB0K51_02315 [Kitasatospora sp. NPDC049285]|uniref:hypothetical protein n=1 Tax=Kitasatospora sp. NPDC049285 TaxID=3157096 RepID=UPI00343FA526